MHYALVAFLALATAASLHAAPPSPPPDVKTLEIGAAAPDFDLPGVDGKNHNLAEYDSADVLAVLFTCNHCPSAQAAEERIKKLVTDYKDESFQLVAISPNDPLSIQLNELGYTVYGDSLEEMKSHAKDRGFNFPYLFDGETQAVSQAYGAMATPHVFIFDRARKLRYVGCIDDSKYADATTIKSHDAINAIDALLAGKPVPVEKTKYHGCSTKWAYKRDLVTKFNEEFKKTPVTVEKIDAEGVKELMKNDTGKLRMVNAWATWCGPCVEEFPELVKVARQFENRGFDFISIATDAPGATKEVLRFLEEEHAALPKRTAQSVEKEGRTTNNYHYTGDSDALVNAIDPEWEGPIPYTVLVAPGGKIIWRHLGEVDSAELRHRILDHLGRFYTP